MSLKSMLRRRKARIPARAIGKTMQRVVEGLRDHAIFLTDPEGIIVSWNLGAERLLGYSAAEAIGMDAAVFFTAADRDRNIPRMELAAAADQGIAEDKRWHQRRDGSLLWATGSVEAVRSDAGALMGFVKVMRDDTDRKRLEEEVLARTEELKARADELLAAGRAKDEFMATLAHELRNPLNSILGWVHILRSTEEADLTTRAVDTIERSAKGQAKLIEDLMDMSQIIAGKVRLEVDYVDLAAVAREAVDVVHLAAESKRLELRTEMAASSAVVNGDRDRLHQVVLNLLANAVKFTPAPGVVTLRVDRDDTHAWVTVEDTGRGISSELLPFVFDRFRQGAPGAAKMDKGLGLGLAIVRQLVELHGGTVAAQSEGEGRGARFVVGIPLARGATAAVAERSMTPCPWSLEGLGVLVVEDERDSREFYRVALERCGARVWAAELASEGFDLLLEHRPDVLLTDIQMPGEDGYHLIARVRAQPPDAGGLTPAAAITSHSGTAARLRALAAGFQMHIPKPVEPLELAGVVATLAGRRATKAAGGS
jgi:PAS domain S-box-containing protein